MALVVAILAAILIWQALTNLRLDRIEHRLDECAARADAGVP